MHDKFREMEQQGCRVYPDVYTYPTGYQEECVTVELPRGGVQHHFNGGGMIGHYPMNDWCSDRSDLEPEKDVPLQLGWSDGLMVLSGIIGVGFCIAVGFHPNLLLAGLAISFSATGATLAVLGARRDRVVR